jgi:hypothetical protein
MNKSKLISSGIIFALALSLSGCSSTPPVPSVCTKNKDVIQAIEGLASRGSNNDGFIFVGRVGAAVTGEYTGDDTGYKVEDLTNAFMQWDPVLVYGAAATYFAPCLSQQAQDWLASNG